MAAPAVFLLIFARTSDEASRSGVLGFCCLEFRVYRVSGPGVWSWGPKGR